MLRSVLVDGYLSRSRNIHLHPTAGVVYPLVPWVQLFPAIIQATLVWTGKTWRGYVLHFVKSAWWYNNCGPTENVPVYS